MNPIKICEKRMNEILPQSIKDTDVISENAKKTLATILNYFATLKVAKETGFLACPNSVLREAVGIRNNDLMTSVQELIECDLITREVGRKRVAGGKRTASIYRVKWQNLMKPIKKKNTFETLFAEFLKPSETPVGTAITNTVSDIVSVSNINSDVITNINSDDITNINSDVINDIKLNLIEKEKNILKKEKEELDERKMNLEEDEAFAEGRCYTLQERRLAREMADVHQYIDQQSSCMSFQDFDEKFNLKIREYIFSKYPRDGRELFLDGMKQIVEIKSSKSDVTSPV